MEYVIGTVLPWAAGRLGPLPVVAFGVSNGAVWSASAAALHPERFRACLAFSLGSEPARSVARGGPPHVLVAGRLEPDFDRATTAYAWSLRARDVPVSLRRRVRGHDYGMWLDELVPALRWALAR